MKKFLIFLVAIVVVVCIGLTTYYFLRNDEAIDFKTKEIYCNVGDVITLDDLGYTVIKEHRNTTYNFNAGGEEVTQYINYNEDKGYYVAVKGGDVNLLITTSNERCPKFNISVHIGDGSSSNPYYIDSQADLQKIGDTFALDADYILRGDITLTNQFKPLGYSYASNLYIGFSGTFDGNGHTISSLNLNGIEYTDAGLFSTLNIGSVVTDLNLNNVNISGSYQTAGALAGKVEGTVARVEVENVNITNTMDNSKTGALIGSLVGENAILTISSAKDSTLIIGTAATESNPTVSNINAIAGGLVGEIDKAKVQATFADTKISLMNANGDIGGFVGKFIIGTNNGSIQESYSISTSEYANFGSFIGTIEKDTNFVLGNSNQLRHLVGNYVLSSNSNVVNSYDETFFNRGFYNDVDGIYYIVSFNKIEDMVNNSEYIFYAIDQTNKTYWDSSAWNIVLGSLPELKMTNSNLSSISSEYFLKDLQEETIGTPDVGNEEQNGQFFLNFIENCREENGAIINKKYVLGGNIDLTDVDWTPIELKNSIIDGNGYKITGLNLTNDVNGNLGLFSVIDNSTIKNLTIEDISINSTNATNAGALSGRIISTSSDGVSNISNVNIVYSSISLSSTSYFGGITATLENNSLITNSSVSNLTLSPNSANNVGGLVANIVNGTLEQSTITNSTVYGMNNVGGAVAENNGTIDNLSGEIIVKYAQDGNVSNVAGISAINNGTISNSNMSVEIVIEQTNQTLYVGGVSAINDGTISNVKLTGLGIALNNVNASELYVGGIAATNNATISNAYNSMDTVGSYYEGKNFYVGGIVANNSTANASITQSIASSDIYGNYVSGVAVNNIGAKVSQVLVANYDFETGEISENYITGDKFVAGICYNLESGEISDIQTVSQLYGQTNTTKTSLLVLLFPNTATLRNATINSAFNGYGTFYRETWKDYTTSGTADNFNIYAGTAASGRMESVVINTERASYYGKSYISAEFRSGQFNTSYSQSNNNNNVKEVNSSDFVKASTFKGTHTLTARVWGLFIPYNQNYVRELTFDFANNVWAENNGIRLNFLANI